MGSCIILGIKAHELLLQASRTNLCLDSIRDLLSEIEEQKEEIRYALSGYTKQLKRCLIMASPLDGRC
ncbi:MAG: hypothetical protein WC910_09350 [Bacteroidales bacterium]|jgi:hypothetical protein